MDKLKLDAQDWAEIIYGIIPPEFLFPCFVEAYRQHKPGYTFECAEMLQTWYKQEASKPSVERSTTCLFCREHNEDLERPPCPFHQVVAPSQAQRVAEYHSRLQIDTKIEPIEKVKSCERCGIPLPPYGDFRIFGDAIECPLCHRLTLRVQRLTEEQVLDAGPPPAPGQDMVSLGLERMLEQCIATTEVGDFTFNCQRTAGHQGMHEFKYKNTEENES